MEGEGGTRGPCPEDLLGLCLPLVFLLGQPHTPDSYCFHFKSRVCLCRDWDSRPKRCSGRRTARPKELTLSAPEPLPTLTRHQTQRIVNASLFRGPHCPHVAGGRERKEPTTGARVPAPQGRDPAPAAPNRKQPSISGPPGTCSSVTRGNAVGLNPARVSLTADPGPLHSEAGGSPWAVLSVQSAGACTQPRQADGQAWALTRGGIRAESARGFARRAGPRATQAAGSPGEGGVPSPCLRPGRACTPEPRRLGHRAGPPPPRHPAGRGRVPQGLAGSGGPLGCPLLTPLAVSQIRPSLTCKPRGLSARLCPANQGCACSGFGRPVGAALQRIPTPPGSLQFLTPWGNLFSLLLLPILSPPS